MAVWSGLAHNHQATFLTATLRALSVFAEHDLHSWVALMERMMVPSLAGDWRRGVVREPPAE